jgi:hypothetical protein
VVVASGILFYLIADVLYIVGMPERRVPARLLMAGASR